MTYTYYINLIEIIISHQKFVLTCRGLLIVVALSISNHVKIRENY